MPGEVRSSTGRRRGWRPASAALCAMVVLCAAPASGAREAVAHAWWRSACAPQSTHRIETTTQGAAGGIVAGPLAGDIRPHISAHRALENFLSVYGPLSGRDRAQLQVRYGRITEDFEGPASANVIEAVPETRRVDAWLVSDCRIVTPPRGFHRSGTNPGTAFYVIGDRRSPTYLGGQFSWVSDDGTRNSDGFAGGGGPAPGSTHYRSVPWHVVASSHRRWRLLLEYRTYPGYAFDHVNVERDGSRTVVSVILSTAAHGRPAAPFAGAPFVEIYSSIYHPAHGFGRLTHDVIGRARFEPISSGVTSAR